MIRRVAAAWDRIPRTHPAPEPPTPPTLAQQRLARLHRVTRVALRFDLIWNTTGEAVEHLEEFDREFLYHLYTADNAAQLFVQAAEQLEEQS